ncbi:MAG: hypothetical protein LBU13_04640 [Synergistaceae bacterium]|jgi:sugar lactone lactonase YvrE|nr:hypothetical protein [Synergistaceae bacterium]
MKKTLCVIFSILLAGAAASAVFAADYKFEKVWTLEGSGAISNPESVFFDADENCLWVANTGDGSGTAKDGFISKISPDGKVIAEKFTKEGLAGPRGTWVTKGFVYTAEVNALVKIDKKTGEVIARYPAKSEGPQQLNDIAEGPDGVIYFSDLQGDKIWTINGGSAEIWLETPDLTWPNGLRVEGGKMYVSPWGHGDETWATQVLSHLLVVDLATKKVSSVGDKVRHGYMDGLVRLDNGHFVVTNWWDGKVIIIDSTTTQNVAEMTLEQSTGDIFYADSLKTLFVPIGNSSKLVALEITKE